MCVGHVYKSVCGGHKGEVGLAALLLHLNSS